MDVYAHRLRHQKMRLLAAIGTGIVVNLVLSLVATNLGLPVYLDTIGTIVVSILCGSFPGIAVAGITNVVCSFFNEDSLYYGIVNVLIAIYSAGFVKKRNPKSIKMQLFSS